MLVVLHVLSIPPVFLSSLTLINKIILCSAVFISLLVNLNREHHFKSQLIRYSSFAGWEIAYNSSFYPIEVLPSTVITPFLLVLHYKQQKKPKKAILICKDALINEEYRKLMVKLTIDGFKKEDS